MIFNTASGRCVRRSFQHYPSHSVPPTATLKWDELLVCIDLVCYLFLCLSLSLSFIYFYLSLLFFPSFFLSFFVCFQVSGSILHVYYLSHFRGYLGMHGRGWKKDKTQKIVITTSRHCMCHGFIIVAFVCLCILIWSSYLNVLFSFAGNLDRPMDRSSKLPGWIPKNSSLDWNHGWRGTMSNCIQYIQFVYYVGSIDTVRRWDRSRTRSAKRLVCLGNQGLSAVSAVSSVFQIFFLYYCCCILY